HLRGFNYTPSTAVNDISFWRDYDEGLVERELTYAQRLGLNSARPFLAYVVYEHDRKSFLNRLTHFVRTAHDRGISVMPVVWDSCFDDTRPTIDSTVNKWIPNPGVQRLGPEFWPDGEAYCADLVQTLGSEPGLAMWDIMNEPLITSWVMEETPERDERKGTIWNFVHHFCGVMKKLDSAHPITVGVANVATLAQVEAHVDVLSYHDYLPTRAAIRAQIDDGLRVAEANQKPIFISELACLARANPYDVTLEICQEAGIGWYLWELMIGKSRWRDIHGVVYPDGTVRDPSIVAAIQGFFRRRGPDMIPPDVDKEGAATRVLGQAKEWLGTPDVDYAQGVILLETIANLLEAGEHVPMSDPPSARALALTSAVETDSNRAELVRSLVLWSEALAEASA
ncbi:MAG: hypothetical protein OXC27_01900, partial [Caldilineaceae bacterium]|nr:hypothetical protein [Caldilineaceae bacterium]